MIIDVPNGVDTMRLMIHGGPGIGKTTFVSGLKPEDSMPNPVFAGDESGKAGIKKLPATDWETFIKGIDWLLSAQHDRKTLAIDTTDGLEAWANEYVRKLNSWSWAEFGSYSRGEAMVVSQCIRPLLRKLDTLRESKGMRIVLLAHSTKGNVKRADGLDFISQMPVGSKKTNDLLVGWCDVVAYATRKIDVIEKTKRAQKPGPRCLVIDPLSPSFTSKTRYTMTDTSCDLSWTDFVDNIEVK